MTQNAASVRRGEVVGGHYELERILGQGGMGTVWCAKDLRLGRSVAIKFLGATAAVNAVQRERFSREARLASRIRSPHVVQVFADGTTPSGVPYVVMELLDGENLATHIARVAHCTLQETESVVEQVCRALGAAHAAGLVHRDIKPANIFLTPQQDGGTFVRLLDFGIAKELGGSPHSLTQSGEVLGTGYYMSPEQLRSPHAVGAATDIWSLGVVLYEMLTGRVPFDADTFPGLVVRVVEGKFPAPSKLRPELPPSVDALVARALQLEPAQRFSKVSELYAGLARIVRANTSEAVIKPEVVRALQARGDTTYRLPKRKRIQDFTTQLLRRGVGSRHGLLALLLMCAVGALGLALYRWANLDGFDDAVQPLGDSALPALEQPLPAQAQPQPVAATVDNAAPAPVSDAPPVAEPNQGSARALQHTESVTRPAARPQRIRRKRTPPGSETTTDAHTAPKPAPSNETNYGF